MLRFTFAGLLAVLSFHLAISLRAWAQPAMSENAKKMVGAWEFSNADRDKICQLTLTEQPTGNAFKLAFDKGCAAMFPFANEVTAWRFADNDFLRLLDSKGQSVAEFSEVEDGIFEAPRPGEGILFIQDAAAAGPPPRTVDQMAGDWALSRNAKTTCTLSLTTTAAGDAYAMTLGSGCDTATNRFGPTTWRMDRDELLIVSPRGVWRFEEGDNSGWERVPSTPDAMTLTRVSPASPAGATPASPPPTAPAPPAKSGG